MLNINAIFEVKQTNVQIFHRGQPTVKISSLQQMSYVEAKQLTKEAANQVFPECCFYEVGGVSSITELLFEWILIRSV